MARLLAPIADVLVWKLVVVAAVATPTHVRAHAESTSTAASSSVAVVIVALRILPAWVVALLAFGRHVVMSLYRRLAVVGLPLVCLVVWRATLHRWLVEARVVHIYLG